MPWPRKVFIFIPRNRLWETNLLVTRRHFWFPPGPRVTSSRAQPLSNSISNVIYIPYARLSSGALNFVVVKCQFCRLISRIKSLDMHWTLRFRRIFLLCRPACHHSNHTRPRIYRAMALRQGSLRWG